MKSLLLICLCLSLALSFSTAAEPAPLYAEDFAKTRYGRIPDGWRDLIDLRPSRNWPSMARAACGRC